MKRFSMIHRTTVNDGSRTAHQHKYSLAAKRHKSRQTMMHRMKVLNEDGHGRFNELVQELVNEHARELDMQRASFEDLIRNLHRTSGERFSICGTVAEIPHENGTEDQTSNAMRGSVPGLMPENSETCMPRGKSIPSSEEPRKPSPMCTDAVPLPPHDPPPALYSMESPPPLCAVEEDDPLSATAHFPKNSLLSDGNDMFDILPAHTQRNSCFAGGRDTVQTVIPEALLNGCDEGSEKDVSKEQTKRGGRAAVNWHGANAKWAALVQLAMNVASVDMHYPRQVWKGKLNNKHTAQGQLANTASKQLKKMMSTVTSKGNTFMDRGRANTLGHDLGSANVRPWFEPLDPHAGPRLVWISLAVVFMVYDLIYVPMQAFDPPYDIVLRVIDTVAQVFWTMDIFCNFVTAVYTKSILERRFTQIARIYARTWLLFDLIVTLPPWYSMFAGTAEIIPLGNIQSVRAVRLLRFLRLVRLAKFDHVVREALEVINSPYTHLIIGTVKLMLSLCIFNHVSSCLWFSIGNVTGGWVERLGFTHTTVLYQYLSSMHWALTQFQGTSEVVPGTTAERAYAVIFLLTALILLACFVSSLTNKMGQITQLHNEKSTQQRAVRNYLSENGISTYLSVKINRYTEWNRRQKHRKQQDAEVLLVLPTKLLMDLYQEVRTPVLAVHPFFRTFRDSFSRVLRRVCYEALEQKSPCPSDLVYAEGDECLHMYFILSGQLRYEPHPASIGRVNNSRQTQDWEEEIDEEDNAVLDQVLESSVFRPIRLKENDWLSEAVLWTEWIHCGDLIGLEDCALLMLGASAFAGIVETFATARFVAALYARHFVVSINRFGQIYTDVIIHAELFDYDVLEGCDKNTRDSCESLRWADSVRS